VASEEALVVGLELLTEGHQARVRDRFVGRALTTEEFRAESEAVRRRAREWTHGRGIEGLGVGEKISAGNPAGELALRVYVERKVAKQSVEHPVPSTVDVPEVGELVTDVVELGHVEPERFRDRARPAMPGCGLGHVAATVGTFGCLVKRAGDDALYILSNSHVLADVGFGRPGDPVVQPGIADGGDEDSDALATLAQRGGRV
jgi:hypothetical protein